MATPDKWQEINLRLDGELAQSLRELKRGHDETLAEVVLRVLRKAVGQNPAHRGFGDARAGGRAGRAASGAGRKGKPLARQDRGQPQFAAPRDATRARVKRKPPVSHEVTEGDTWAPASEGEPARGAARGRAPRPFTKGGKGFRPQPGDGGGVRVGRGFAGGERGERGGHAGGRRFPAKGGGGAKRSRVPGARKAKGRRPGR